MLTCEHGSIAAAQWAGNLVVSNMTNRVGKGYGKAFHNDVTLPDFRYAFDYLTRGNYIFESAKLNLY
jgi:hypothetical protein